MYYVTSTCYVCLDTKNNLISSVDSSMSVKKELLDIFKYCAHNLAWLKTKRYILICEECCSRLRETYKFLKMWHKNNAILQGYMDQLNTKNKAEPSVHVKDMNQVQGETKHEEIHTAEEYPMGNNSTKGITNESDSKISVNTNTHITDTDSVSSDFTCKQALATNKKDSNAPANKPHTCSTCRKSFIIKKDLKRHTLIHTGEKPYKCDRCDKGFGRKYNLECHIRTHTGDKPYNCARCNKSFSQKPHLVLHIRTHTGDKPFKCACCDTSFSQKIHLVCHMRVHTGAKPYKCDRCDKGFGTKYNLMIHMRTHTGERPLKCVKCDKNFRHHASLLYHMRTHNSDKF